MTKWITATGDVVTGDTIKFSEAVFGGSFRRPSYLGDREIVAIVVKDSYGASKQQHTFSMVVKKSSGEQPLKKGQKIRRKGRNVYKNGTLRLAWKNEADRSDVADEKHNRGDAARSVRDSRRASSERF